MTRNEIAKNDLHTYKQKVDAYLSDYFASTHSKLITKSPILSELRNRIAEFTLRGGKRLRPALVYYTYMAFRDEHDEKVVKLSIFMELLQSFFLIHDDIMDRSSLRRGKPTLHKAYEMDEFFASDPKHSSLVMGILAGDIACQFAYEMIAESNFSEEIKGRLIQAVANKIEEVIYGQTLDYALPFKKIVSEDDVLEVHHYKTATYTYELPLLAGAILAGKEEEELEVLKDFATAAGIAFQLKDDILGMFGDKCKTGKLALSDIAEGKVTLLVLKAREKGSQEQLDILSKLLGKSDLTEAEAELVREIVIETGSLEYSEQKCQQYIEKGRNALSRLGEVDNVGWRFLSSISEYLGTRQN